MLELAIPCIIRCIIGHVKQKCLLFFEHINFFTPIYCYVLYKGSCPGKFHFNDYGFVETLWLFYDSWMVTIRLSLLSFLLLGRYELRAPYGLFWMSVAVPSGWTHVVLNYIGPNNGQGIRIYHDESKPEVTT